MRPSASARPQRDAAPGQTCSGGGAAAPHSPSGSHSATRDAAATHHVVVKLGNGDDIESVCVNGTLRGQAGYDEYRTIDLGRLRSADVIELEDYNNCCGYSWGFDVIVDGVDVYHDWAGTVTSYGANGNDPYKQNTVTYDKAFPVGKPPKPPKPDESGLSSQWCGSPAAASSDASRTARVPRIKLVYAYPSDRKDNFRRYAQVMESDAQAVSDKVIDTIYDYNYYYAIPGAPFANFKSLRFDTGTSCGPQYVNIARVRLDKPERYWLSGCARGDRLFEAAAEVRRALAGRSHSDPVGRPLENYAIYADGFIGGRCLEAGIAEPVRDPSPGWYNRANRGGYVAMVNGGGADAASQGPDDFANGEPVWFRRDTLLHEIMHTFGAVLDQARHSTGRGHCIDGPDVMCYDDGGPRSAQTFPCGDPSDTLQRLDCNYNDYFDPGERLIDWRGKPMWNTYDSAFLCQHSVTQDCTSNVKPPHARLTASKHAVTAKDGVRFDTRGSSAGDAAIVHYQWFTERNGHRAHELKRLRERRSPRLRLKKAGSYAVIVRVTDSYGSYSIARVTVRVSIGGRRHAHA